MKHLTNNKSATLFALSIFWASNAISAEGDLFYIKVDADGKSIPAYKKSELDIDLTYPPDGERANVIDVEKGDINQGVPISNEEYKKRLKKPHIIIGVVKASEADRETEARVNAYNKKLDEHFNRAVDYYKSASSASRMGLWRTSLELERAAEKEIIKSIPGK